MNVRTFGAKAKASARFGLMQAGQHVPGGWPAFRLPRGSIPRVANWANEQTDSQDWIQGSKGLAYLRLAEPLSVVRQEPHSIRGARDENLDRERWHRHPELFVARIPRGRVLPPTGLVLTEDGYVLEESVWGREWVAWYQRFFGRGPKVTRVNGPAFSLVSQFAEGHAHWLLETLPRLMALDSIPDGLPIIVPSTVSESQWASLEHYGIKRERCIVLGQETLEPDVLYLPSYMGTPGNVHPLACQWLRGRFENAVEAGGDERLYLTRESASRRKLANENDLRPLLDKYNFRSVDPGMLTFHEQVNLFAGARIILAPHGSALANVVFAPTSATVIEIREPIHRDCAFYAAADACGQDYWFVPSTRQPGVSYDWTVPKAARDRPWADLLVDIEEVEETLEVVSAEGR